MTKEMKQAISNNGGRLIVSLIAGVTSGIVAATITLRVQGAVHETRIERNESDLQKHGAAIQRHEEMLSMQGSDIRLALEFLNRIERKVDRIEQ